jgi:hypothetical protein
VRHPRPEVGDPQIELARDEGRREVPPPRLVSSAVVILDQLFCHEFSIVVGHAPEVVADAPYGDDGVVERIPEDRREEEAVDHIPQPS